MTFWKNQTKKTEGHRQRLDLNSKFQNDSNTNPAIPLRGRSFYFFEFPVKSEYLLDGEGKILTEKVLSDKFLNKQHLKNEFNKTKRYPEGMKNDSRKFRSFFKSSLGHLPIERAKRKLNENRFFYENGRYFLLIPINFLKEKIFYYCVEFSPSPMWFFLIKEYLTSFKILFGFLVFFFLIGLYKIQRLSRKLYCLFWGDNLFKNKSWVQKEKKDGSSDLSDAKKQYSYLPQEFAKVLSGVHGQMTHSYRAVIKEAKEIQKIRKLYNQGAQRSRASFWRNSIQSREGYKKIPWSKKIS